MVYGLGCALLMVSTMVQYGPFFNGPAGIAIPIGLPVLIVIGYFLWKDAIVPTRWKRMTMTSPNQDDASYAEPLAAPGSADAGAGRTRRGRRSPAGATV